MRLLKSNSDKLRIGMVFFKPKDSKKYVVMKRCIGYVEYSPINDLTVRYSMPRMIRRSVVHIVC